MKKLKLSAFIGLAASIISLSSVAAVDIGEFQDKSEISTKTGSIVSKTYFHNGEWYTHSIDQDKLFGIVSNKIFRSASAFQSEIDFKKAKDNLLLDLNYKYESSKGDWLNSKSTEIKKIEINGQKYLSLCFKESLTGYEHIPTSGKCDFNNEEKLTYTNTNFKGSDFIKIIKQSFSYADIEVLAYVNSSYPISFFENMDFVSQSLNGNVVTFLVK